MTILTLLSGAPSARPMLLFFLALGIIYISITHWIYQQQGHHPKIVQKDDVYVETKSSGDSSRGVAGDSQGIIKHSKSYIKARQTRRVLLFNRVPKTGSEMMDLVIKWLKDVNHFTIHRLRGPTNRFLTYREQVDMAKEVYSTLHKSTEPFLVVDRHVYFTNFTSLGYKMPTYFSLVRDPVEKLISRFYYSQITPRPGGFTPPGYERLESPKYTTLADCAERKGAECTFITGKMYDFSIPYFCGHEEYCRELNNHMALAMAKHHVEEWYPVVGVLEELNATLITLETTLPKYFRGAMEKYYNGLQGIHYNKNVQKPKEIDPAFKIELKRNLSLEYDFYEFIKSRLYKQFLKIPSATRNILL